MVSTYAADYISRHGVSFDRNQSCLTKQGRSYYRNQSHPTKQGLSYWRNESDNAMSLAAPTDSSFAICGHSQRYKQVDPDRDYIEESITVVVILIVDQASLAHHDWADMIATTRQPATDVEYVRLRDHYHRYPLPHPLSRETSVRWIDHIFEKTSHLPDHRRKEAIGGIVNRILSRMAACSLDVIPITDACKGHITILILLVLSLWGVTCGTNAYWANRLRFERSRPR